LEKFHEDFLNGTSNTFVIFENSDLKVWTDGESEINYVDPTACRRDISSVTATTFVILIFPEFKVINQQTKKHFPSSTAEA